MKAIQLGAIQSKVQHATKHIVQAMEDCVDPLALAHIRAAHILISDALRSIAEERLRQSTEEGILDIAYTGGRFLPAFAIGVVPNDAGAGA